MITRRVLGIGVLAMAAGDGLRRPLNAPSGGEAAVGVQPGISNGVQFARLVIVFGPAGTPVGVFVYNGTPAPGNPPIASMTSGITDPYGNPVDPGVNGYATVSGVRVAIGLNQTLNAGVLGTLPGFTVQSVANPPFSPSGFFAASTSIASVAEAGVTTGQVTAADVAAILFGESQAQSGVTRGTWQVSAGKIFLGNNNTCEIDDIDGIVLLAAQTSTPPATAGSGLWADLEGNINAYNVGDGNTYRTGRLISFGDSGQLISSTTPVAITGMTINVGIGSYHITGAVNFTGTAAAGSAQYGFGGGSSTVSHADGGAFFLTPGVGLANASVFNGALALAGSPVLTGALQRWEFDVWVTFSTPGTFILRAQEGTAGDSFTVNSGYIRAETYN